MTWIHILLSLLVAPSLWGIINKTKAFFAGRKGPPFFQLYYDLWKVFQKIGVYSRTTTSLFYVGPLISLAAIITALLLIPLAGFPALIEFSGDCILLVYLLATARFFTITAALDTGSSFEGMGASREGSFSVLAEPTFFLCLATLISESKSLSLSEIYTNLFFHMWEGWDPTFLLVGIALFLLALIENCRIPFDDPNTHLELTMIHEVMVLDHSAIDLGCILYGTSLKLWIFGALIIGLYLPLTPHFIIKQELIFFAGMALYAVIIGCIESVIARVRLVTIFDLLLAALGVSIFAFILQMVR